MFHNLAKKQGNSDGPRRVWTAAEERRIAYWMAHPGYEVLAGESTEMTAEIIRRVLERGEALLRRVDKDFPPEEEE